MALTERDGADYGEAMTKRKQFDKLKKDLQLALGTFQNVSYFPSI